jgi:hypothetical protein
MGSGASVFDRPALRNKETQELVRRRIHRRNVARLIGETQYPDTDQQAEMAAAGVVIYYAQKYKTNTLHVQSKTGRRLLRYYLAEARNYFDIFKDFVTGPLGEREFEAYRDEPKTGARVVYPFNFATTDHYSSLSLDESAFRLDTQKVLLEMAKKTAYADVLNSLLNFEYAPGYINSTDDLLTAIDKDISLYSENEDSDILTEGAREAIEKLETIRELLKSKAWLDAQSPSYRSFANLIIVLDSLEINDTEQKQKRKKKQGANESSALQKFLAETNPLKYVDAKIYISKENPDVRFDVEAIKAATILSYEDDHKYVLYRMNDIDAHYQSLEAVVDNALWNPKSVEMDAVLALFYFVGELFCVNVQEALKVNARYVSNVRYYANQLGLQPVPPDSDELENYFPLTNYSGIFSYRAWLEMFLAGLSPIGVPADFITGYDDIYGCPATFIKHDFDHDLEIRKNKELGAIEAYMEILREEIKDKPEDYQEMRSFLFFIKVHEDGIYSDNFGKDPSRMLEIARKYDFKPYSEIKSTGEEAIFYELSQLQAADISDSTERPLEIQTD